MLTKDKIIGIFCFIDDLLKTSHHYEDSRRQVSESEVISTAMVSSLYFGGHQDKARQFMKMTGMVPSLNRTHVKLTRFFPYISHYIRKEQVKLITAVN